MCAARSRATSFTPSKTAETAEPARRCHALCHGRRWLVAGNHCQLDNPLIATNLYSLQQAVEAEALSNPISAAPFKYAFPEAGADASARLAVKFLNAEGRWRQHSASKSGAGVPRTCSPAPPMQRGQPNARRVRQHCDGGIYAPDLHAHYTTPRLTTRRVPGLCARENLR